MTAQLALNDCEPDWDYDPDDTTRIDYRDRGLLGQHATAAGIRGATTLQPAEEYL